MTFDALQPLADRAALFTALRQDALVQATDALGNHRWDVDLTQGTLTFTSNDDTTRRIVARAHLVATIAPGPRSLLWAWARPDRNADDVAEQLRRHGIEHEIAALSEPELPFPAESAGDEAWIIRAAHTVGGAAVELTGQSPYYAAPVGNGTYAVFLLDVSLPPLTVGAAVAALPRVLSNIPLSDQRTSVWNLARLAGWDLAWVGEDFSGATVADATGSATFRFDAQARITNLEGALAAQS